MGTAARGHRQRRPGDARRRVVGCGAPGPADRPGLRDALAPADPGYQAVHFSCHGCPAGVRLEDRLGRERLLSTADLAAALRADGSRLAPALAALNACETLEMEGGSP